MRKAERCDFGGGGDTENREYANAIDHDQLAAAFGEPDVGQRRLTRGKAADMGITVFALCLAFSSIILGSSDSCWPVRAHMHYCVCPCRIDRRAQAFSERIESFQVRWWRT